MAGIAPIQLSNSRDSACQGKQTFLTQALAAQVGGRQSRRETKVLLPYHCPFCRLWHVGHKKLGVKHKNMGRNKSFHAGRMNPEEVD